MRAYIGILIFFVVGLIILYLLMSGMMPTLADVQSSRGMIDMFVEQNPVLGVLMYMGGYIVAVALSIPVATVLTVLAGFLFGPLVGTGVVVISATIGGSVIFLLARFFFRDFFTERLGGRLAVLNRELSDHGFTDVLLLRLAPVVPFALVNVGIALTSARFRDYALATFIGTIPFTFVYVQAGTQLAEIEHLRDIVSPGVLFVISLVVVVGFIPVLVRRLRHRDSS